MKSRKMNIVLMITNIILIVIICNFIIKDKNLVKERKIIKEMTETEQVTNLQKQLDALNDTQTEYANYIQSCKTAIATTLTKEGVITSSEDTFETMSDNISKIFIERTKLDSTIAASSNDIAKGKQAYVNGELVIGNNKNFSLKQLKVEAHSVNGAGATHYIYIDVKKGDKINFGELVISKTYGTNVTGEWCAFAYLGEKLIYGSSTFSSSMSFEIEKVVKDSAQIIAEEDGVLNLRLQVTRRSASGGTMLTMNNFSIE